MLTEKSKGMKGRVLVTVTTDEEARGEVRLRRGGKLGLASHVPANRLFKPAARQFHTMPVAIGIPSSSAPSQS